MKLKTQLLLACTMVSGLHGAAAADEFQPITYNGTEMHKVYDVTHSIDGKKFEGKGIGFLGEDDTQGCGFDGGNIRSGSLILTPEGEKNIPIKRKKIESEKESFDVVVSSGDFEIEKKNDSPITKTTFLGGFVTLQSKGTLSVQEVVFGSRLLTLRGQIICLKNVLLPRMKEQTIILCPSQPEKSPLYEKIILNFTATGTSSLLQGCVDFKQSRTSSVVDGNQPLLEMFNVGKVTGIFVFTDAACKQVERQKREHDAREASQGTK